MKFKIALGLVSNKDTDSGMLLNRGYIHYMFTLLSYFLSTKGWAKLYRADTVAFGSGPLRLVTSVRLDKPVVHQNNKHY